MLKDSHNLRKPGQIFAGAGLLLFAIALAPTASIAGLPLNVAPERGGITPLSPEVIARFAPEIRLHPDEVNYPSSVDWYLGRCVLRFISHQDSDGLWQHTYDPSPISSFSDLLDKVPPAQLDGDASINTGAVQPVTGTFVSGHRWISRPSSQEDFVIAHLNTDAGHADVTQIGLDGLVGPLPQDPGQRISYYADVEAALCSTVPAYVWVNYSLADQGIYDLVFYLFRPYNGPTAVPLTQQFGVTALGHHEGDWGNVAVRIQKFSDGNFVLIAVNYSAHGFEGGWYMPMSRRKVNPADQNEFDGAADPGRRRGFSTVSNTDHPLVYAALGSHANYSTPEDLGRRPGGFDPGFDTAVDALDDDGARWQTWKNLILVNPDGPLIYGTDAAENLEVPEALRIFETSSASAEVSSSNVQTAPVPAQDWINFNGRWGNWLLYDQVIGETSLGPRSPAARGRIFSHEEPPWTIFKPLQGGGTSDQRPVLADFGGDFYQFFTGSDILVSKLSDDDDDWIAPGVPTASIEGVCPNPFSDVTESAFTTAAPDSLDDWFTKLSGSGATAPAVAEFNNALYMAVVTGVGNNVNMYRTLNGQEWCMYDLTSQAGITADTQLGMAAFDGKLWVAGKATGSFEVSLAQVSHFGV